jgi:hypothetical protein
MRGMEMETDRTLNEIELKLIGVWSLVEWRCVEVDGATRFPFGTDAIGSLHYAVLPQQGGIMSAQLSMQKRQALRSSDTAKKCAAFDSYVAYAGQWRVDGNRVIHRVFSSLFPNWVGTELVRTIAFVEDRLLLSTVPPNRKTAVHHLTWRRGASGL